MSSRLDEFVSNLTNSLLIHLVFGLLLFRKKLPIKCKCDFMNMCVVNACVSLEGIRFFSCINDHLSHLVVHG